MATGIYINGRELAGTSEHAIRTVGKLIRNCRIECGMDHLTFMEQAGIGKDTLYEWERDRAFPDDGQLEVLSRLFESEGVKFSEYLEIMKKEGLAVKGADTDSPAVANPSDGNAAEGAADGGKSAADGLADTASAFQKIMSGFMSGEDSRYEITCLRTGLSRTHVEEWYRKSRVPRSNSDLTALAYVFGGKPFLDACVSAGVIPAARARSIEKALPAYAKRYEPEKAEDAAKGQDDDAHRQDDPADTDVITPDETELLTFVLSDEETAAAPKTETAPPPDGKPCAAKPDVVPGLDTIADTLKAFREKTGLNVPCFAKKAGIHKNQLCNIENGRSVPAWCTAEQIADAIGALLSERDREEFLAVCRAELGVTAHEAECAKGKKKGKEKECAARKAQGADREPHAETDVPEDRAEEPAAVTEAAAGETADEEDMSYYTAWRDMMSLMDRITALEKENKALRETVEELRKAAEAHAETPAPPQEEEPVPARPVHRMTEEEFENLFAPYDASLEESAYGSELFLYVYDRCIAEKNAIATECAQDILGIVRPGGSDPADDTVLLAAVGNMTAEQAEKVKARYEELSSLKPADMVHVGDPGNGKYGVVIRISGTSATILDFNAGKQEEYPLRELYFHGHMTDGLLMGAGT